MTEILYKGKINKKSCFKSVRPMSFVELLADIRKDFSMFDMLLFRKKKNNVVEDMYPGWRIPIKNRGRIQWYCLKSHIRAWTLTKSTSDYCHHCPFYEKQTAHMDSSGITETCGKACWHWEAN